MSGQPGSGPVAMTRRGVVQAAAATLLAPPGWAAAAAGGQAPRGLLCNLLPVALAAPADAVRLSWIVAAGAQAAYQLQVAEVGTAPRPAWDSGRVASDRSVAVAVPAGLLTPDRLYCWRVRTWGASGAASRWSPPCLLGTAPNTWQVPAIWAPDSAGAPAEWALLRHGFDLPDRPVHALLRAGALSPEPARQFVFRLWLNGSLVGVGPPRSPERADASLYATWDVTALLRRGGNALSALCYTGEGRAFQAELVLHDVNGSRRSVASGPAWRALDGAGWRPPAGSTGGNFYLAPEEAIDARAEPLGWSTPDFDDHAWRTALTRPSLPAPRPIVTEPLQATLRPAARIHQRPGGVLIDFGQEVVGGLVLQLAGIAGAVVEVRLGEELDEDGNARDQLRCGQTYRERWTLRDGNQTLEHWGYRAFRWASLLIPRGVRLLGAQARTLALPWRTEEMEFTSSDAALNRVHAFCAYSIKATRLDLYQDTPTRERGPYEGDALVNQLGEYATQRSFGLARYSADYLIARPTWPTEYRLMMPVIVWRDYLATGDDRLMRDRFAEMIAAQLLGRLNGDGLVEKDPGRSSEAWGDLVDWPISNRDGFVFRPINTVINAWQYASLVALANIAGAIGQANRATEFARLAACLRDALNRAAMLPDGTYRDGVGTDHRAQHATAFAVALGVTPEHQRPAATAWLAAQGMRMSVYGAQFLLEALYVGGRPDDALHLMTASDDTSWLGMMDRWGATITMEAWTPAIKPNTTFSHAWGTGPVNIVARHLLGVQAVAPGARRLLIAPQPGRLQHVKGTVPTIRGPVRVAYSALARTLTINLPANSVSEIRLPPQAVSSRLQSSQAVLPGSIQGQPAALSDLKGGTYHFNW